jgi:hypothetical protein
MSKGPKKAPDAEPAQRCLEGHCKKPTVRMSFCPEHFEDFKFGLLRKDGSRASDYDRKIEHFSAFQKRSAERIRKTA